MRFSNHFNLRRSLFDPRQYNNTQDVTFLPSAVVDYILEDNSYVPRFSVNKKYHQLFQKFPINKELKYDPSMIVDAIQYGMILLIQYRGAEDEFMKGHSRVVYPMVLGRSSKGKELLRAYHLKGWSVSKRANIEKEWRLFRTERIVSVAFTGQFFRLAPEGYNMRDKSMVGGVTRAADFNEIRRNQQRLLSQNVIQSKEDVEFDKIDAIMIDDSNTTINLREPFENINIKEEDKNYIRLSFLKKAGSNDRISILGALGKPGNRVRVYSSGNYMGIYDVERSVMGNMLGNSVLQNVGGYSEFPLYIFLHKK